MEKDMILLISVSEDIPYFTVISKQYPTKYLAMSFLGREDKRELYILSYGTLTPPCKAQDSFT
jgi:hypothetical protein